MNLVTGCKSGECRHNLKSHQSPKHEAWVSVKRTQQNNVRMFWQKWFFPSNKLLHLENEIVKTDLFVRVTVGDSGLCCCTCVLINFLVCWLWELYGFAKMAYNVCVCKSNCQNLNMRNNFRHNFNLDEKCEPAKNLWTHFKQTFHSNPTK